MFLQVHTFLTFHDYRAHPHVHATPRTVQDLCTMLFSSCSVDRWMSEMPTQVIVPTGRFTGHECTLPQHPSVTVVPHSDHCSYDELLEFVKLVKPVAIQPIVHIKECLNMSRFEPFLTDRSPVR